MDRDGAVRKRSTEQQMNNSPATRKVDEIVSKQDALHAMSEDEREKYYMKRA